MAPSWPSCVPLSQVFAPSSAPCASLATKRGAVPMPSICPLSSSVSCSPRDVEDAELEARRAGIEDQDHVGHGVTPAALAGLAAGLGDEHRDRAGGEPGDERIGPAGQDDRHPRAEHDAGGIGAGHEGQALGEHVARLEVGHQQDVGAAGHRRIDLLDARRLGVDGVVERQRAVDERAGDLVRGPSSCTAPPPRSSTAPSELTVSIAESTATRTSAMPRACARSIAFCRMSTLSSSVGHDVDRGVGDDQGVLVAGHVHHEAVADAPRGAQPGLAPHHGGHQLVGVQAALHQRLGLAFAHQLHRRRRRRPRCAAHRRSRRRPGRCPARCATARMRSRGPTRIGTIRPMPGRLPSPPPATTHRKGAPPPSVSAAAACRCRSGAGTSRRWTVAMSLLERRRVGRAVAFVI